MSPQATTKEVIQQVGMLLRSQGILLDIIKGLRFWSHADVCWIKEN